MRFHGEALRDRYDAVVVGSGIGGLTSAALLATAGRRVLVVERHDRVGGYAHAFRRGRYAFDSAVHLVGGCEPNAYEGGALIHDLLRAVGARDRCEFERIDPCFQAVYPSLSWEAPGDIDDFKRVLCDRFPQDAKGVRHVLDECLNMRIETRRVSDLDSPLDAVHSPDRFPTLLRYRRATLGDVLEAHIRSPQLRALLGTLWPYLGLPPSRVSFLYFATMLMSYLAEGAYYCRGTFQTFADALAGAVTERGGDVLLRSPVRRICVEDGRATGVILENGQRIEAPLVVSNADATQTIEELVGRENFPARYTRNLRRLKPSLSAFVAYVATSLPLSEHTACHETFLYDSLDHDAAYQSALSGTQDWLSVTIPSLADPGLCPEGEHLMIMTTLIPFDASSWREGKDERVDRLIARADRHFRGLAQNVTFAEGGTPRTLERYTRNTGGALYGWELSPGQVGPGRLDNDTPIAGLHLAGHWTRPGGGIYGVVSSGIRTARSALGFQREDEMWRAFGVET